MRLNSLADEYGDAVNVTWKSFLLRGEPEERSMEKFTKYTNSWERPGSMEPRSVFNTWSGEHEPPSHSIPSAVAGKAAASFGSVAYRAFSTGLFNAYFTENRTVSERSVQLDVAETAGLDRADFAAVLNDEDGALLASVWSDYRESIERGVTGVPAVVVADQWLLPGAMEESQYRRIIERAMEEAD